MSIKEVILDIVNMLDLTTQQTLNFIACSLYVIAGLMIIDVFYKILVPLITDLVDLIFKMIEKANARKEEKKNANK